MSFAKRIILVLSLCVFAGCSIYLGKYFYDSYKAWKAVSEIQDIVQAGNRGNEAEDNETADNKTEEQDTYAPNGMIQGYYDAYLRNNDMVGWINIPDTKINYPVMHRSDSNEYYLHKNFDREYSYSGLPFLDSQCDLNSPEDNFIIYAHNMRDGSMFAALIDYEDKKFFEKNQIINFDTNYERGKYQIFTVFSTKVGAKDEFKYYEHIHFTDKDDFNSFIEQALSRSYYDTGISVQYGDRLLLLSTCSYNRSNERTVVMAKRIE